MTVVPLVFFSLVVGAASISPAKLGRVGVKILVYYIVTTVIAVAIGLVFGNIFHPGWGLSLAKPGAEIKAAQAPSVIDTLLNIVPKNPVGSLSTGDVLPIIFFAIIFGIGISFLKESKDEKIKHGAEIILTFCNGAFNIMLLITRWVLQYAPIGVFALIAVVLGTQGAKVVGPLGLLTLIIYIAYATHLFLVYGGISSIFRLNFFKLLSKNKESMVAEFVTRSGSATLPIRLREADENMGISKGIYSFTVPLGTTINMDGAAIYMGICTLFVAFAVGMKLNFTQQMIIILTATLASIGTAAIPGGSAIMLLMVLNSVGLKVETGSAVAAAYAMILGIDAILDMGRTVLNCEGDMVGSSIVAKTEGELNLEKWK
jgi:Na+/H+-dicarboxylate symporter